MIVVLCIISVCLLSSLFMTHYLYTALEKKKTELKKLKSTYDKLKQYIERYSVYRTYDYMEAKKSQVFLEPISLPKGLREELNEN